jgi:S-adenosylmethionine uptake transporter
LFLLTKTCRFPMSAPLLMVLASFLFATMSLCVKLASAWYGAGEIVLYRGLVGMVMMACITRYQGQTLKTSVPGMHLWRCAVGTSALSLWFYAIGGLPLATAVTLNYMSSIWMALFLIGGAVLLGGARVDTRLVMAVLAGFAGVAAILRPTFEQQQLWHGLIGLLSGVLSAMAYLQVTALGRAGEPESRVVFYFSAAGAVVGLVTALGSTGLHPHTSWQGPVLLLAVGVCATTAQVAMTRAYSIGRPLVNASLQYLGIAFSYAYGVFLLDDAVTALGLTGTVLIVGAGVMATRLRQEQPAARSDKSDIEA